MINGAAEEKLKNPYILWIIFWVAITSGFKIIKINGRNEAMLRKSRREVKARRSIIEMLFFL
jgi:hypothetical protein